MNRLKLYMRLVTVTALFVLGGVGVYKGRKYLQKNETEGLAQKDKSSDKVDKSKSDKSGQTSEKDESSDDKSSFSANKKTAFASSKSPSASEIPKSNKSFGGKAGISDDESDEEESSDESETEAPTRQSPFAKANKTPDPALSDSKNSLSKSSSPGGVKPAQDTKPSQSIANGAKPLQSTANGFKSLQKSDRPTAQLKDTVEEEEGEEEDDAPPSKAGGLGSLKGSAPNGLRPSAMGSSRTTDEPNEDEESDEEEHADDSHSPGASLLARRTDPATNQQRGSGASALGKATDIADDSEEEDHEEDHEHPADRAASKSLAGPASLGNKLTDSARRTASNLLGKSAPALDSSEDDSSEEGEEDAVENESAKTGSIAKKGVALANSALSGVGKSKSTLSDPKSRLPSNPANAKESEPSDEEDEAADEEAGSDDTVVKPAGRSPFATSTASKEKAESRNDISRVTEETVRVGTPKPNPFNRKAADSSSVRDDQDEPLDDETTDEPISKDRSNATIKKSNPPKPFASAPAIEDEAESEESSTDTTTGNSGRTSSPDRSDTTTKRTEAVSKSRYANDVGSSSRVKTPINGIQAPSIVVEKSAPTEVEKGKPSVFELHVRNVADNVVNGVRVVDRIPPNTKFVRANPNPSEQDGDTLIWNLGSMGISEEKIISIELVPLAEGEIESVAEVSFQAQAGSRSVVTKAKLAIEHENPQPAHEGDKLTVRLVVTNTGTGAARDVTITHKVPMGLTSKYGRVLDRTIGALRPGESQNVSLPLRADKSGRYELVFSAMAGDVRADDTIPLVVVAPSLKLQIEGPRKRAIDRPATHQIRIDNLGTTAARDVEVTAVLPRGLKFVKANNAGRFDQRSNTVVWNLDELPQGESGAIELVTTATQKGDHRLQVEAKADRGATAEAEHSISVDASSDLAFSITDAVDPIETGAETTYEIRLTNRGAKDANHVKVVVAFPNTMRPLAVEGPIHAQISGNKVVFETIDRLSPGSAPLQLRVHAQAVEVGDHRIAAKITSDEHREPITREESTVVYSDQ